MFSDVLGVAPLSPSDRSGGWRGKKTSKTNSCVAGNSGKVVNLVIWRIFRRLPNLKSPI